jgi:hypothetical protein
VQRLQAAIDTFFDGNKTAFGKAVGYADGAFIRQLLSGARPLNEKVIRKIGMAVPKLQTWFDPNQAPGVGQVAAVIARELAHRDVPAHVTENFLALIRGFPLKELPAEVVADLYSAMFQPPLLDHEVEERIPATRKALTPKELQDIERSSKLPGTVKKPTHRKAA